MSGIRNRGEGSIRYSDDPEVRAVEEIFDKEMEGTAEAGAFLRAHAALSKKQQMQMWTDMAEWMNEIGMADFWTELMKEIMRRNRPMPPLAEIRKEVRERLEFEERK